LKCISSLLNGTQRRKFIIIECEGAVPHQVLTHHHRV
jgi:hypothetical protein